METEDSLEPLKKIGLYFEEDLSCQTIPKDVLNIVSKEMAAKYHLLPIFINEKTLVAVTDTEQNFKSHPLIQKQVGMPLKILIASAENVKLGLFKFYQIENYRQANALMDSTSEEAMTPLKGKLNAMLQNAASDKTSDIHILPWSGGIYVWFRINGHLVDVTAEYDFKVDEAHNIVNILKSMCNGQADTMKTTMPDGGSFLFSRGTVPIFVRLATVPVGDTTGLQKVNLRLLPQGSKKIEIDEVGYQREDLTSIKKALFKSATGLFLNSGPTGSGKTTSLYAQLRYLKAMAGEPLNIMTIDDPIEIREETFTQVQVHESAADSTNLTKSLIMKVGLRSDPDIFLYNEIRNKEDAMVAIEASTTGHRTFSTVHASNCIKTISRLLDLNISKVSLLSELRLIISQRLVGLLCPDCSEIYALSEEEKSILSPSELTVLKTPGVELRKRGSVAAQKECKNPQCNHGYIGRAAVAEYVIFNNEIRDVLLHQQGFREIEEVLKKHDFKSMWDKGFAMVLSGQVELNEVIHVIGKEE